MNRPEYFNYIEERLNFLAYRIEVRGRMNLLDLNIHSEDFYQHFLNLVFDRNLENLNILTQNAQGVDLVDKTRKIVAQVSATATRQKIESALSKDLSKYVGYKFRFVAIAKDASSLRSMTFINPSGLEFTPATDIYDVKSLLDFIKNQKIEKLKEIYDFLKKELKTAPDPEQVETHLATIIKVLSEVNWAVTDPNFKIIPYDIDAKIAHNELVETASLIEDHSVHYHRIDRIYSEFDEFGSNKSLSILNGIKTIYLGLATNRTLTPDDLLLQVVDAVIIKIRESSNYVVIPDEELLLSVQILVVDAFIRCKIFKNPTENTNASA